MRRTSPALEAQVAAALAAGWPIVAIAEQTGISLSTVKRIRGRSGVRPDSMREELIEEARAGLRASLSSEFAASEGARLVRSQVALCNQIHTKTAELLESLTIDSECDRHQAAKILSACATASKLAADGLRRVLTLAAEPEVVEALPELVVRDYTDEEILAIRAECDCWGDVPPE
ncbi:helix-turn-helix domain-containing protein [Aeromonas veronii]|uniref:helix-turn-helix domain-containing protein n=1 Tax=Aeromonas veronii TaxID=654 RepID=UPI003A25E2D2